MIPKLNFKIHTLEYCHISDIDVLYFLKYTFLS